MIDFTVQMIKLVGKRWKEKRFLLAVSGGVDSMVLLNLVRGHLPISNFIVAHVNYNLRGDASMADEDFVISICKELNIKVELLNVDTENYKVKYQLSTQEAARQIRYNWFDGLTQKHNLDYLITAHHADDDVETFFINLKRGSGLNGLKGIPEKKDAKLRPLLPYNRADILNHAETNQVEWREDASNSESYYLRNQLRNEIIPQLNEKLPNLKDGIKTSLSFLKDDYAFFQYALEKELAEILVTTPQGYVVKEFKNVHPRVLLAMFFKFGFNASQLDDIITTNSKNAMIYSSAYELHLDRYDLHVVSVEESSQENKLPSKTYFPPSSLWCEEHKLVAEEREVPEVFTTDNNVAELSSSIKNAEWEVVHWQAGDRIRPIGMKGTKLIGDLLMEFKVPAFLKHKVKVLKVNGKIAWLIGFKISEDFKVMESDKNMIRIETIP